ncbi:MAG: TrkH family potassium uptake protein [Myxococcota bacterium]
MRQREYTKHRYFAILSSIGVIFLITSAIMLAPLLVLFSNPSEAKNLFSFLIPAAIQASLGLFLWKYFKSSLNTPLSVKEGGIIVLIGWTMVILFSSIPFILITNLSFSQAVFEAVSGWTTTGLSVVDVTKASKMILFWRSSIQLAGGAGLAIIMMSAIIGPAGVGVSSAEGRSDQLVPHVKQSARLVLIIYIAYAVAGTIAYWLAGMSFFDAINHSFAAISTGGFSTRPDSIGHWNSVALEAVTFPLMLLGNLSFVTGWFLWRGKFKTVFKNGEVRLQAIFIPLSVAIAFIFTTHTLYTNLGKAFRVALFETFSALTTTGFSTVGYSNWNSIGIFLLIVLMLIGGGTCSTAGGIKQIRVFMLFKFIYWELKRQVLPEKAVMERPVWEGNRKIFINDSKVRQVTVFVFLYLFIYILGVMSLCAHGYNLRDSLFEFASALGTVGLSVGVTSADMPKGAMWTETFAMFLGRLEFIVVIISLIKIGKDCSILFKRSST